MFSHLDATLSAELLDVVVIIKVSLIFDIQTKRQSSNLEQALLYCS